VRATRLLIGGVALLRLRARRVGLGLLLARGQRVAPAPVPDRGGPGLVGIALLLLHLALSPQLLLEPEPGRWKLGHATLT
jgi:hypothetical protein